MYLVVKFYYNMLREIKIQGRYVMLGIFLRFDIFYFLLCFRCCYFEGVIEIENKKWLERDLEVFKQFRLVLNYDWLCVVFSILGFSSFIFSGLDLGLNFILENIFFYLLLIYMYYWFLDCF